MTEDDEKEKCVACARDQELGKSDFTCPDHPRRPTTMFEKVLKSGTCRACGRALVQTQSRTYHPVSSLLSTDSCPALLPILGTDQNSFEVPADQFMEEPDKSKQHDEYAIEYSLPPGSSWTIGWASGYKSLEEARRAAANQLNGKVMHRTVTDWVVVKNTDES